MAESYGEQKGNPGESFPKFSSPEEELRYLRERILEAEKKVAVAESTPSHSETIISEELLDYTKKEPSSTLAEHLILDNPAFERVVEHLTSVPHREKMRELYQVLKDKGILVAVSVARGLHNPHIDDDFHGVLVEYIRTGVIVPGLEKERELKRELEMTLFEVSLPPADLINGNPPAFSEIVEAMQRIYVGLFHSTNRSGYANGYGTFELVLSNFSTDLVFYIAVPNELKDLFLKLVVGAFPTARIEEEPNDYNIFNEFGVSVGSVATASSSIAFPLNKFEGVEQDPIKVIVNAFNKIERDGEGAAIQFVAYPDGDNLAGKFRYAIGQIKQNVPVKQAINIPLTTTGAVVKSFTEFFRREIREDTVSYGDKNTALEFNQKAIELIEEKISQPIIRANIRIVASAGTQERAETILRGLESAFAQYARPQAQSLHFQRLEKDRAETMFHDFVYRQRNDAETVVLNLRELASLYHLPASVTSKESPQLRQVMASVAPAPMDLPKEGVLLGYNKHRGENREVRMSKLDRLRHLYVIGQTGTGKTTLLKNMIVEDIKKGEGVCFIDPHGSDIQDILANVPPERAGDVIYFDPSYTPRPFGLNMLEYDVTKPEQKTFVVDELLSIFKKLYSAVPESMGPAFEQYFRNATMLVIDDPETGSTMLEISRVLADAKFRELKLSRCKNPIVVQFWREIAGKAGGEASLANMVPYITNKFDVFISNEVVRPIIGQEHSSFDFRQIMDSRKILLVNLAKGRLGDINAHLIGLILVGKILMAALSRVDAHDSGTKLPDFYLYIDEFQNVTTDSISSILSEARKYGLSLNVAHQYIGQLDEKIKNSVFGNVGSMAVFRVGAEDAQFLESQYAPVFSASDIMKIENRNAYMKMLVNGSPVPPFNILTSAPPQGRQDVAEQLKQLSYLKYGKDRRSVDELILRKYASMAASAQTKPIVPQAVPPVSAPVSRVVTPTTPVSVTPVAQAQVATPSVQIFTSEPVSLPQGTLNVNNSPSQSPLTSPPVPVSNNIPTSSPAAVRETSLPPSKMPFQANSALVSVPRYFDDPKPTEQSSPVTAPLDATGVGAGLSQSVSPMPVPPPAVIETAEKVPAPTQKISLQEALATFSVPQGGASVVLPEVPIPPIQIPLPNIPIPTVSPTPIPESISSAQKLTGTLSDSGMATIPQFTPLSDIPSIPDIPLPPKDVPMQEAVLDPVRPIDTLVMGLKSAPPGQPRVSLATTPELEALVALRPLPPLTATSPSIVADDPFAALLNITPQATPNEPSITLGWKPSTVIPAPSSSSTSSDPYREPIA